MAASKTNIDMLNGPLGRKILRFAIPIALSSIFQQMFNLADVAVVGQFAGDKALAAVGANTFVINMLINLFVGISVGANVVVANSIGARSYRSVTRSVHTSVMMAFFSGFFLSFVGIFFARPILTLISTPADVLDMAVRYLQIYFAGMPFVMIYNFISAILRSKGDTKRPLYVLMVAGAVNVALNLVLVAGFDMGVAGVAIATVIANVISGITLFYILLHEVGPFKLEFWKLRVTPFFLSRILRVGLPTGLRGVVFSFSNVCLQSAINSLGSATVAASSLLAEFVLAGLRDLRGAELRRKEHGTLPPHGPLDTHARLLHHHRAERALLHFREAHAERIHVQYRDHRNRIHPHVRSGRAAGNQRLPGRIFGRTFWNGQVATAGAHLHGRRLRHPHPLGDFRVPQIQLVRLADGRLPRQLGHHDCGYHGNLFLQH